MQKKLQIFISSTFTDLIEERQAAVEAVLNSGHIPAGMELFKSGDKSQKETIKRWIEESDAYMLILGGRYGSLEEESGKSYTHWEYDYAGKLGKPRFAVVIEDSYLEEKVKTYGMEVIERENPLKYNQFKKEVLEKISKFYSDIKDIKLTVLESLKEFERDTNLTGWVSGNEVVDQSDLLRKNFNLLEENEKLKKELDASRNQIKSFNELNGGFSYEEIRSYLSNEKIKVSKKALPRSLEEGMYSLLDLFQLYENKLAVGVMNVSASMPVDIFIFFNVAPKLMKFNLVEKVNVTGKDFQRIQTTKEGYQFLSKLQLDTILKN